MYQGLDFKMDTVKLLPILLLLLLCYGNIIKNDIAFLKLLLVDFGASDH